MHYIETFSHGFIIDRTTIHEIDSRDLNFGVLPHYIYGYCIFDSDEKPDTKGNIGKEMRRNEKTFYFGKMYSKEEVKKLPNNSNLLYNMEQVPACVGVVETRTGRWKFLFPGDTVL